MLLPLEIPLELKKYEKYQTDQELVEEIQKHPAELKTFFLYACEDETWAESHLFALIGLLNWLTEAHLNRNFPSVFFDHLLTPIQKHIHVLKPLIPLDLNIKIDNRENLTNSLLLSLQSHYFRRRLMNECRGKKNPVINVTEIPVPIFQLINEFIFMGEIKDLWKTPADELWAIIAAVAPFGFSPLVEAIEKVLRRYIDRSQAFEMLIRAHRKHLQILQNACIEFINPLDLGVRLQITPVEYLSMEFLDYKDYALEAFKQLSSDITHLVFSREMTIDPQFKIVINKSPKLIGLDLSDSTIASTDLIEIPERIQELHLSHCVWVNKSTMQILSTACPKLSLLDLSSNSPLTYAVWSELQRFKKLIILDISRCSQVSDSELRIILQACPKLVELKLVDCQKITPEGFFEIGKLLPELSLLNASRTLISDTALIDLMARCKNLYSLDLSRCFDISDKGVMEGIRNCPGLKIIYIGNSGVTANGISQIRNNYPYLNIL